MEYVRQYFSTVMKNTDVRNLYGVCLYIQLNGVDEKGDKPNSQPSITIYPSKMENVDWDHLTIEDLRKKAHCILDPTQPA